MRLPEDNEGEETSVGDDDEDVLQICLLVIVEAEVLHPPGSEQQGQQGHGVDERPRHVSEDNHRLLSEVGIIGVFNM